MFWTYDILPLIVSGGVLVTAWVIALFVVYSSIGFGEKSDA